jgi:enoyl-CoA hydratase/carnithine racemase
MAIAGGVAHVTFDRPRARNAMTWAMYDQLGAHLAAIAAQDDVRVTVLRGAGGTFIAGTDIAELEAIRDGDDGIAYERRLGAVVDALERLPMPSVAAIDGYAAGGGLVIAAACDLRICTPAARFGAPIARTVGNTLSVASTARLLAHFGASRTKTMLIAGGFLGADEARAAGFVMDIVSAEILDERVAQLCERIASHAPMTLRATKEIVRRLVEAAAGDDDDIVRAVYGSRDFREGVRAFIEKRDPEWEGK